METKLIVHGVKQFLGALNPNNAVSIFVDNNKIGAVDGKDTQEFIIQGGKTITAAAKKGYGAGKGVNVQEGMVMEISCERGFSKINVILINSHRYDEASDTNDDTEKAVYIFNGARGRRMEVYEDRVVMKTKATVGSFITGNATDGEKTIYYVDCIGVQFKASGVTLGYIQLETASSSMNNRGDNHFNENSFTFDGISITTSNEAMRKVADYIQDKVREGKQAKSAPTVITNAVSPADEIKKFKELLDMGIITQEEFDAKKKELLGL